MHRRLAELKEQLTDARAERKADAATYASNLNAQQVVMHSAPHQRCRTLYTRCSPLTVYMARNALSKTQILCVGRKVFPSFVAHQACGVACMGISQLCRGMQVRLGALQEANDALTSGAARVPQPADGPSALGRSIQDAMAMLQDSPILREQSRNATNTRRLSPSGLDLAPSSHNTWHSHPAPYACFQLFSALRIPETYSSCWRTIPGW